MPLTVVRVHGMCVIITVHIYNGLITQYFLRNREPFLFQRKVYVITRYSTCQKKILITCHNYLKKNVHVYYY